MTGNKERFKLGLIFVVFMSVSSPRLIHSALRLSGEILPALNAQERGGRTVTPPSVAPPSTVKKTTKTRDSGSKGASRAAREKAERERLKREADDNLAKERAERERAERETAREREAREAAELKRKELEALLPNAKFESVSTEAAFNKDGVLGLRIHLKFDVNNLKDVQCLVGAQFYDSEEKELKDVNGDYATVGSTVYTGDNVKPPYVRSSYSDFPLFIPYEELHLSSGNHALKLFAYLRAGDKTLTKTEWVAFSVTAGQLAEAKRLASLPRGKMEAFRVDGNTEFGGKKGMMIHFNLTLYNLNGVECKAVAFFHFANETALPGKGAYATDKNTLMTDSAKFTPTLVAAFYEDMTLFIPFDEIKLADGKHELKFFVSVLGKNIGYFTQSNWVEFTLTRG